MREDRERRLNPVDAHPSPEFPEQKLEYPGLESRMDPAPDYGEESYRGSGRLEGKSAVITGGDSGIGRAVALAFAREGADVLISYLEAEESDARETVRVVEACGRKALTMPGDIGDETQCERIVERAASEFGKIDVLVNNAAYQMSREDGLMGISAEELERTFRTNVFSMFYLCRAALPRMEAGASVINTCSIEASQPKPPLLDYAATKAAIVNFTKGLAMQLTPQGIRVNCVAPGPVWTPLIPATMPPDYVSSFGGNKPMGRPAQPVEVAPAYVFLASDESSYVSGQIIGVTGGELL